MANVKVIVLRAAGTNCDVETAYAFEKAGAEAHRVHVNRIAEGSVRLSDFHILAIPGGFTYGDDIAAGRVLANEMRYRIGDAMRQFVEGDRLVIGICNGFQVLVKMGLLPGYDDTPAGATLTFNDSNKFEDRWVYLKIESGRTPFLDGEGIIYLPVAHAEGKFVVNDPAVLQRLELSGQIIVKYCDEEGNEEVAYPYNPNGSTAGVAGICDDSGRVFGLMPHPERNVEPYHHPRWTRTPQTEGDGMRFFTNAVDYFS
ncbi:MAG: phosphoribosylformylglycinamidine synthase I [Planctomycetota bacterium]|jgi:phosphoribosylformylglycinamidine synthase